MMRIEPSVEADLVRAFLKCCGKSLPVKSPPAIPKVAMHPVHKNKCFIVPGIISMHDSPECLIRTLEVEPRIPAGGIIEIPCVDCICPLHQLVFLVPPPG